MPPLPAARGFSHCIEILRLQLKLQLKLQLRLSFDHSNIADIGGSLPMMPIKIDNLISQRTVESARIEPDIDSLPT